jgi:FlaA1/EpsC-like NDP-sugar epimerase
MEADPEVMDSARPAEPSRRPVFWERHLRRQYQLVLDVVVLAGAFALSYLLRFEFRIPPAHQVGLLVQLPFVVLIQFLTLQILGTYRFVWRYVGMTELYTFLRAAIYATVPILVLRLGLPASLQEWKTPLSIILMDAILGFGGLVCMRVLRRWLFERFERSRRQAQLGGGKTSRVLLIGAGRAGVLAARELQGRADLALRPVGFVDDDPQKQGAVLNGLPVLGDSEQIAMLAERYSIDHAIITIANANARTIRSVVAKCEAAGLRVRIIPGLYEILDGRVEISRIRDLAIEDLLGRQPVQLDEGSMGKFIAGKRVVVTGAGGSIGSELARQLRRFEPAELILVERSEAALFEIELELRRHDSVSKIVARVADVGDEVAMRRVFRNHSPDVVLHAAAHKHVPLMEQNSHEAVRNNVLGTELLGRIAGEEGVEVFVMLSTDKAVRPSSVMGASKRLAELVLQGLNDEFEDTRYVAVRFGNVMGSAGSVVPIFRRQIADGGPVTVTHPDATRYFMTIPEASQLVLQAGALALGGEIMILDMGKPVPIVSLARDMVRLSGLTPDVDIEIAFVGLRPGEKLEEELFHDLEAADPTRHPKIVVANIDRTSGEVLRAALRDLERLVEQGLDAEIRGFLARLLPEARLTAAVATRADGDAGGARVQPLPN